MLANSLARRSISQSPPSSSIETKFPVDISDVSVCPILLEQPANLADLVRHLGNMVKYPNRSQRNKIVSCLMGYLYLILCC